jgi:hypothetical protein
MMEHTKEPWFVEGSDVAAMVDQYPTVIADCLNHANAERFNAEANARRIVACVNACAGIPTELIEEGGFAAVPVVTHRAVKQQRDGLLEALLMAVTFVEAANQGEVYQPTLLREKLAFIKQAIAKAEE